MSNSLPWVVVLDTESTSWHLGPQSALLALGAVRVNLETGECVDRFYTPVASLLPIPTRIRQLTGITPELLVGAPLPLDAVTAFQQWRKEAILAGHGLRRDLLLLDAVSSGIFGLAEQPLLDTAILARDVEPAMAKQGEIALDTLLAYHRMQLPPWSTPGGLAADHPQEVRHWSGRWGALRHHALGDALLTAGVLFVLWQKRKQQKLETHTRVAHLAHLQHPRGGSRFARAKVSSQWGEGQSR
ncbi:MAG: hypothetical protein IMW91_05545 [Firmicutes bacterium]|nr:hypothetical protein [Bacillota bacterium]